MDRWEIFAQQHQESCDAIRYAIEGTVKPYEDEYQHLIQWLFASQHNPYGIFHEQWAADAMTYAEGFASICRIIHHALCDDGDICFPVVNSHPYICFAWQHDQQLAVTLLKEDECSVRVRKELDIYTPPTLTFLSDAYAFTSTYDEMIVRENAMFADFARHVEDIPTIE